MRRIYNRMVFDELEKKSYQLPFAWSDDLDVTWCSHPNWYWTWSKVALPYLTASSGAPGAVPVRRRRTAR